MLRNGATGIFIAGMLSISLFLGGSILVPSSYALAGRFRSIGLTADPTAAVYDSSDGYVYIATAAGTVAVVQGTDVIANITVPYYSQSLAYDSANGYVYAASAYPIGFTNGTVSIISGSAIVGSVKVGSYPSVFYDPYNHYVYCLQSNYAGVHNGATRTNNSLSVISGTQILATLGVGHGSPSETIDSDNGYVYVAGGDSGTVSVVSGTQLVGTVNLGLAPGTFAFRYGYDLAYDNATGTVYAAAAEAPTYPSRMFVISGLNISASITGFSAPILYNPADQMIYAMQNESMTTVSVISGTKAVANVTIPSMKNSFVLLTPSLSYDPYDAQVYAFVYFAARSGVNVTARMATILESAITNTTDFPVKAPYPTILLFNPGDRSLYVSGISQNAVTIIPSATVVTHTTSASTQTSSESTSTTMTGSGTTLGNPQPAPPYTSYLLLALAVVVAAIVAVLVVRRFRGRAPP